VISSDEAHGFCYVSKEIAKLMDVFVPKILVYIVKFLFMFLKSEHGVQ